MRKRKIGRKFSRERDQRRAFLKSLAANLILKEKIRTTVSRAKETSRFVEKLISQTINSGQAQTEAKEKLVTKRRLLAKFFSPTVNKKLFQEIGPRYKERKGGYTRVTKLGPRKSDGAAMAVIELIK